MITFIFSRNSHVFMWLTLVSWISVLKFLRMFKPLRIFIRLLIAVVWGTRWYAIKSGETFEEEERDHQ